MFIYFRFKSHVSIAKNSPLHRVKSGLSHTGICLLYLFTLCLGTAEASSAIQADEKFNGVSLESPPRAITEAVFKPIAELNANYVAIIPYAFSSTKDGDLDYNYFQQWWGEKPDGVRAMIEYARKNGLKVMLKPHVWVRGEGWPGDYDLASEAKWLEWQNNYREYILFYAQLAESQNVELFSVGTEYRKAAVKREAFWRTLIDEVRQVYSGKITYAANWDNFTNIPFWDKVDFIGIDAYFPLVFDKTPPVTKMVKAWHKDYEEIKALSKKYQKQVIFAEFGYKSVDGAAGNHWELHDNLAVNQQAQTNAYKALFKKFWDEEWFAGGFLWKWHLRPISETRVKTRFTPQGKHSEKAIREHFSQYPKEP